MKNILFFVIFTLQFLPAQEGKKVLIVYFSKYGHTEEMAKAVLTGAKEIEGVSAVLRSIGEVTKEDLLSADAIILGSPVYNSNAAPEVMEFINSWPFKGEPLKDKIGAAFVTGGGISAGEEVVQLNILHSMLIFGMVVVGGDNWHTAFGASAVTEESPFNNKKVDSRFLDKAKNLGRRVSGLTLKIR